MHVSPEAATPLPPVSVPAFVANNALHLILMPTERCNFRCVYCYEDFANGRMERPTIDGIHHLLAARAPHLDVLRLEWFGGEPLLEPTIVMEVQSHLAHLQNQYERLKLSCSMTTNGYFLSKQMLGQLTALGVTTYQVSLDGGASEHDARRPRADGQGTFERIWSNLLAARDGELAFVVRLRIHADRENLPRLPRFLERLSREFRADARFEVNLRQVSRLGGPQDASLPCLESDELGALDELRRYASGLGLKLRTLPDETACYASAANSFVVRSTGEISKCTVALRHPNNIIGRLSSDGKAAIDDEKLNHWVRGLFSFDADELACPMKGFAEDRGLVQITRDSRPAEMTYAR